MLHESSSLISWMRSLRRLASSRSWSPTAGTVDEREGAGEVAQLVAARPRSCAVSGRRVVAPGLGELQHGAGELAALEQHAAVKLCGAGLGRSLASRSQVLAGALLVAAVGEEVGEAEKCLASRASRRSCSRRTSLIERGRPSADGAAFACLGERELDPHVLGSKRGPSRSWMPREQLALDDRFASGDLVEIERLGARVHQRASGLGT